MIGKELGQYIVVEALGEGGMASVYKGYDKRLERDVAIKVIQPGLSQSTTFLKRFEREAKSIARLTHVNIVNVINYGFEDGMPYLVMEFIPGGTLKDLLGKPMPWREAARMLIPVAKALGYAHEKNIIHRDIKPSNFLVTQSGDLLISDFGIAKTLGSDEPTKLTGTGVGIGTPAYMAPEQGLGKPVDQRVDIYSLGVVFYEMVTGRPPYQADTPLAVMLKHVNDPLPRPKTFVPDLPEAVEKVIFKALSKKPEDRYQTMGDFAKAFESLLQIQSSAEVPAMAEKTWLATDVKKEETGPAVSLPETAIAIPLPVLASGRTFKRVGWWGILGAAAIGVIAIIWVASNRKGTQGSISLPTATGVQAVSAVVTQPATQTAAGAIAISPTPTFRATATALPTEITPTGTPIAVVIDLPDEMGGILLRSEPAGKVIQALLNGSVVDVLSEEPVDVDGQAWYQVRTPDGTQGWVLASLLTQGGPSTETAGGARAVITKDRVAEISGIMQIDVQEYADKIGKLAFSRDGNFLIASGYANSQTVIVDVEPGILNYVLDDNLNAVSPDGSVVFTFDYNLWATETGEKLQHIDPMVYSRFQFSPDSKILAECGYYDNTLIRLWDVASGEVLKTLQGHKDGITGAAFSPDGRTLVTTSDRKDVSVRFWDVESGKSLGVIQEGIEFLPNYASVSKPQYQPGGKFLTYEYLSSSSASMLTRVVDAKTMKIMYTLSGGNLGFSPSGEYIVMRNRSGTEISVYDTETGKLHYRITRDISQIAFLPNTDIVISHNYGDMMDFWDIEDGALLLEIQTGHGRVLEITTNATGSLIATGGEDGTIRFWGLAGE